MRLAGCIGCVFECSQSFCLQLIHQLLPSKHESSKTYKVVQYALHTALGPELRVLAHHSVSWGTELVLSKITIFRSRAAEINSMNACNGYSQRDRVKTRGKHDSSCQTRLTAKHSSHYPTTEYPTISGSSSTLCNIAAIGVAVTNTKQFGRDPQAAGLITLDR